MLCIGDLHIPHRWVGAVRWRACTRREVSLPPSPPLITHLLPARAADLPAKFRSLLVPGKIHHVLCTGNLCTEVGAAAPPRPSLALARRPARFLPSFPPHPFHTHAHTTTTTHPPTHPP